MPIFRDWHPNNAKAHVIIISIVSTCHLYNKHLNCHQCEILTVFSKMMIISYWKFTWLCAHMLLIAIAFCFAIYALHVNVGIFDDDKPPDSIGNILEIVLFVWKMFDTVGLVGANLQPKHVFWHIWIYRLFRRFLTGGSGEV